MSGAEMLAVTSIGDGTVELREVPKPTPVGNEVLVKVLSSGINGADLLQIRGLYPSPLGWPRDIVGLEFAGEIVGVGERVDQGVLGRKVMGIVGSGGQCQYLCTDLSNVIEVPKNVPIEVAGGIPETFLTAFDALFDQANLSVGDCVCIHGGAGGVGTAAIQLAKSTGAHVTATVRNKELRPKVESLGCEVLAEEEFQGSGPYDVILELVGAKNLQNNLKELNLLGRIVVIGVGAGATTDIDLRALMATRGTIRGSTLRNRSTAEKATLSRAFSKRFSHLLDSGTIAPVVDRTFSYKDVSLAYEHFRVGGKLGKVILTWD
ncbi:NADPH:quinone reductase [Ferrithrix thermotolerans DSM 19514]|uniref:NADPH:quinone reductase n=1 Tax=Ferrithrix thermotolerans DSM 19514 TaxID=1121881 RepID=A0A1M4VT86_9ACTN|nr:zinc-binding dehydrogenase [Ferrithrix thermotolerans]SHE72148.1 NADPH:quinone reductase [Ferrithrix thermotolerans DSM 19514]